MSRFLGAVPLSVAALALLVVVALLLSGPLARALQTRRSLAAMVLSGFGLVVAATLVPTTAALEGNISDGVCDTSRMGIAPLHELTTVNVTSLNVLLFVPLGVAIGLLPWSRAAAIVALLACLLTFVVETIQLLLPVLGRGCQTADMVDNLMGFAIGLLMGSSVHVLVRDLYRTRPKSPSERSEPD